MLSVVKKAGKGLGGGKGPPLNHLLRSLWMTVKFKIVDFSIKQLTSLSAAFQISLVGIKLDSIAFESPGEPYQAF